MAGLHCCGPCVQQLWNLRAAAHAALTLQGGRCPSPGQLYDQMAAALRRAVALADQVESVSSFTAQLCSLGLSLQTVGLDRPASR